MSLHRTKSHSKNLVQLVMIPTVTVKCEHFEMEMLIENLADINLLEILCRRALEKYTPDIQPKQDNIMDCQEFTPEAGCIARGSAELTVGKPKHTFQDNRIATGVLTIPDEEEEEEDIDEELSDQDRRDLANANVHKRKRRPRNHKYQPTPVDEEEEDES